MCSVGFHKRYYAFIVLVISFGKVGYTCIAHWEYVIVIHRVIIGSIAGSVFHWSTGSVVYWFSSSLVRWFTG